MSTTWETTGVVEQSNASPVTVGDASDLDVPDFMKPEYVPAKAPARRGEPPAMTVARRSGHSLGSAWRGVRTGGQWFTTGTKQAHRNHRYWMTAGEYEEKVGIKSDANWNQRAQLRKTRRLITAGGAGGGIVLTVAASIALAIGAGLPAGDAFIVAPVAETAVASMVATGYGRRVIRRQIAAAPVREAIEPGAVLDDDGEPFPLSQAHDPEQARICILRALRAESIAVADVYGVVRKEWGWQCIVRVSEGTPETIIAKAGDLETRFDLPTNGVRPQPMVERRACAVVRLVSGDPFATAPGMPYRAPKSMSITDKFRIGTSVGGEELSLSLAGVMGLWVAASGGGKTGILQALAEGTTACRDNITVDLDPHGDGLEDLHDAVRITARTTEQIEAVLLFFLVMSKARARLRTKLGMGKKWIPSPEHPAVTIFFDEFPRATELSKRLALDLLNVGRKELIEVQIASQGGTKHYLSENIAQMIALTGVGPCKVTDTRAVFGDGSVAEGWQPHKLSPATDTDPKDAGHIFIQGVPGRQDEPIEYKVHETVGATLRRLGAERKEAGLVEPDEISLDAMRGVDLPEYVEAVYDNEGELKKEAPVDLLSWEQLLRLCEAEPPAGTVPSAAASVVADAVEVMDRLGVDRMRTEILLAALVDFDPAVYREMVADELKGLLAEAGAGKPVTLGQIDGLANPRGFKREQLTTRK